MPYFHSIKNNTCCCPFDAPFYTLLFSIRRNDVLSCFVFSRYNLVTPLTSMIVLREDEKKEIEEQLKKEKQEREKEEKRKEEERKKKLDEEEAKLDEKLLLSSSLATTTTSPSGGGFYGDPHFLIPILSDFYLCFDWNGENGEVT